MNILIVEDEYKELLFLTNFVRRSFPDMAIVGAVNNGKAALEAGRLHTIDLALLDIELPVHDGLYVAEQLKKATRIFASSFSPPTAPSSMPRKPFA